MMNLQQAMMAAMNTPSGAPEFQLACEICVLRGIDPHHYPPSSNGIANWQKVIAEQLLEQSLRDVMQQPV